MGIGFRKRVKIAPGVNLNFSRKGVSATIGAKGASVNIGKNGVYANASIPGTGIYARNKIVGGRSSSRNMKEASNDLQPYSYDVGKSYTNDPQASGKEAITFLVSFAISFVVSLIIMIYASFWIGMAVLIVLCIIIFSVSKSVDEGKKHGFFI